MRLDRTVRFYVDVVIRDEENSKPGDFDKIVRHTQNAIGFTGPIRTPVRDETLDVNYSGVIETKEVPF